MSDIAEEESRFLEMFLPMSGPKGLQKVLFALEFLSPAWLTSPSQDLVMLEQAWHLGK